MDSRPVGVFDSGVGGLTVLHECLVTMPNEDFVYLGDHARLPYGPRPLEEIRRFAREIGSYLEQQDVKLILVACNAATSAALPRLQEELTVPVVGVITPEAHAAVQATRNRRVGLLEKVGDDLERPQLVWLPPVVAAHGAASCIRTCRPVDADGRTGTAGTS